MGELDRDDLARARQLFVVEPVDGRLGRVRIIVGERRLTFALTGRLVSVDPNLWLVQLLVQLQRNKNCKYRNSQSIDPTNLDNANGAKVADQLLLGDVEGTARDEDCVLVASIIAIAAAITLRLWA